MRNGRNAVGAVIALSLALQACSGDATGPAEPEVAGPVRDVIPTAVSPWEVGKTANTSWTQVVTYDWTLAKTGPAGLDIPQGQTKTAAYGVTATRSAAGTANTYGVRGEICVKNNTDAPTLNLRIEDRMWQLVPPSETPLGDIVVDVSANPVLEPGESHCYPYEFTLASGFVPDAGATYRNKGYVFSTDTAGKVVRVGETPAVPVVFPAAPTSVTSVDATLAVTDAVTCPSGFTCTPSSASWVFDASGTRSFDVAVKNATAACGQPHTLRNVVEGREATSQQLHTASVTTPVTVSCASTGKPQLEVTKRGDADRVQAGTPIKWTITVRNTGASTAKDVRLLDILQPGWGIDWELANPVAGCSLRQVLLVQTLSCSFGDIAPGAAPIVIELVSPTAPESRGYYANIVKVWADNHSHVLASDAIVVEGYSAPCLNGCAASYWKGHTSAWSGYQTGQKFSDVFGVDIAGSRTLLATLQLTASGGKDALAREATAALLNAAHQGVAYGPSPDQVIAIVRVAVKYGKYDFAVWVLKKLNERNCPLR